MEITKMLTLSTAHLKDETVELLDSNSTDVPPHYNKADYGWFVYVPEYLKEYSSVAPADLMACLRLAQKKNCTWVMFDRDADPIRELPCLRN